MKMPLVGFLAGSEVYRKAQEDLLVQSHRQKVREDFIKRLASVGREKRGTLTGKLSEMM